jgi:hypothetical protein
MGAPTQKCAEQHLRFFLQGCHRARSALSQREVILASRMNVRKSGHVAEIGEQKLQR